MLKSILRLLGSLKITVIGLLLLTVLTIWGTLYQADYGLYLAQDRFYRSWFFLIGGVVPFPGAQAVMCVMFVNLVASIAVLAMRGRLRWSMVITHAGLLLMLAAGAVTFYLGRESQLSLEEGQASNTAVSFTQWDLVLLEPADSGHSHSRRAHAMDIRSLRPGRVVPLPAGDLAIRVEECYRNAEAITTSSPNPPRNMSGFTGLNSRPKNTEPSRDVPGLIFTLLRNGEESGQYLLWANDPNAALLEGSSGTSYIAGLRRKRLPLPALIKLIDFQRELHPGSMMAKSYSSDITVQEGDDPPRKVTISMNKPLRIKGYTFYQSSFADAGSGREISTFSVVLNYGRTMPYVATGLTVVGMTLHFLGLMIHRLKRQKREQEAAA